MCGMLVYCTVRGACGCRGVECELVGQIKHGDHTVFVGEVKSARLLEDGEALTMASTGWNYGG